MSEWTCPQPRFISYFFSRFLYKWVSEWTCPRPRFISYFFSRFLYEWVSEWTCPCPVAFPAWPLLVLSPATAPCSGREWASRYHGQGCDVVPLPSPPNFRVRNLLCSFPCFAKCFFKAQMPSLYCLFFIWKMNGTWNIGGVCIFFKWSFYLLHIWELLLFYVLLVIVNTFSLKCRLLC